MSVRVLERTKRGFKVHLERVQNASEQHFREDVRSRLEAYEHSLSLRCGLAGLEDPSVEPIEVDGFPRVTVKLRGGGDALRRNLRIGVMHGRE